ncbi:Cell number regulator 8 [Ancistrocladus abbreviatus]
MAKNNNIEESSPLLVNPELADTKTVKVVGEELKKNDASPPSPPPPPSQRVKPVVESTQMDSQMIAESYGWTANGLPLGVVRGQPLAGRTRWDSSLLSCLGRQDEFCSSDVEVCLLGAVAPCVLYGSNAERTGSAPGTFTNHCMTYTALYLIGNVFFGWNCLAPWLSYTTRTAVRRRFNLEGNFEAFSRTYGCCRGIVEDDVQREQCETACDFATHFFCHPCSLCQEGREMRRRVPHPAFNAEPILVMIPPSEQTMGRNAA